MAWYNHVCLKYHKVSYNLHMQYCFAQPIWFRLDIWSMSTFVVKIAFIYKLILVCIMSLDNKYGN